jgi:hypothetical protein
MERMEQMHRKLEGRDERTAEKTEGVGTESNGSCKGKVFDHKAIGASIMF